MRSFCQDLDQASDLVHLRARYYDPASQQFLSKDPAVGRTGQPYGYAGGDPANVVDPAGLEGIGPYTQIPPGASGVFDLLGKAGAGMNAAGGEGVGGLGRSAENLRLQSGVRHTVATAEGTDVATHSGWSNFYIRKGFRQVSFDTIKSVLARLGVNYTFPEHPQGYDQGVAGRYYGTHAEVQMAVLMLIGDVPLGRIGISKAYGPCAESCSGFFKALATATGRTWEIEVPSGKIYPYTPGP